MNCNEPAYRAAAAREIDQGPSTIRQRPRCRRPDTSLCQCQLILARRKASTNSTFMTVYYCGYCRSGVSDFVDAPLVIVQCSAKWIANLQGNCLWLCHTAQEECPPL